MLRDYISISVKNSNTKGDSICSIGVVVVKGNKIIDEIYSVINPEDEFDDDNSEIIGLSYSDVKDGPTFIDFWKKIEILFIQNTVVGHNIKYDLSVISKVLEKNNIPMPKIKYYRTVEILKKTSIKSSYSLDKITHTLNIELNEKHNALDEARATMKLFEYLQNNFDIGESKHIKNECKLSENLEYRLITSLNVLYGILVGIQYDKIIDEKEVEILEKWMNQNRMYQQSSVLNWIITKLETLLHMSSSDGSNSLELTSKMLSFNNSKMYVDANLMVYVLNGILQGIICNKTINITEIKQLRRWLMNNDYLKNVYMYDKVVYELNKILKNGILTDEKCKHLCEVFEEIIA